MTTCQTGNCELPAQVEMSATWPVWSPRAVCGEHAGVMAVLMADCARGDAVQAIVRKIGGAST